MYSAKYIQVSRETCVQNGSESRARFEQEDSSSKRLLQCKAGILFSTGLVCEPTHTRSEAQSARSVCKAVNKLFTEMCQCLNQQTHPQHGRTGWLQRGIHSTLLQNQHIFCSGHFQRSFKVRDAPRLCSESAGPVDLATQRPLVCCASQIVVVVTLNEPKGLRSNRPRAPKLSNGQRQLAHSGMYERGLSLYCAMQK